MLDIATPPQQDPVRLARSVGNNALPGMMAELVDRAYQADDHKALVDAIGVVIRLNGPEEMLKGANVTVNIELGAAKRGLPVIDVATIEVPEPTAVEQAQAVLDHAPAPEEEHVDLSMFDLGAIAANQS